MVKLHDTKDQGKRPEKKINQKNVNKKTTAQIYETDLAAVLYT